MTPESRLELIEILRELLERKPDYRVGQLICNLAYLARGWTDEAVWDVEDEELLESAKSFLQLPDASSVT
jgi:hypothetical protein